MFQIFLYIKIRRELLRKVSTRQVSCLSRTERRKMFRQVKDMAWLCAKHGLEVRTMTCRVKRHVTKFKVIHKFVEINGELFLSNGKRVTFQLSNQFPSPYRMVMYVYNDKKSPAYIHGNVEYCFDMLISMQ